MSGEGEPLLSNDGNIANDEEKGQYESIVASRPDSSSSSDDIKKSSDIKPTPKGEEEVKEEEEGSTLVVAFLLMCFFSLGNRIFGRLETYPMHNYPMFMNMLSVIMYIPMSFAYVVPAIMFTDNITPEQLAIPQYKFAVMGLLDSIAGTMAIFAVNFIPNASMIVLVQQSAIPISMVISFIWLQARYTKYQYVGAIITLLGIVLVLLPQLLGSSDEAEADKPGSSIILWYSLLILSCIPMCLSSVYKEKELGEIDIDVVYLNGWVAVWQFLFAIPLCIPSAMLIGLPMSEIMPNMYDGWYCYLGINSITESTLMPKDDCDMSFIYVTSYLGNYAV
jgi:drug/metabolite transporter (DMT)-like permease